MFKVVRNGKIRLNRLQIYAGLSTFLSSMFYVAILFKYGASQKSDNILYAITILSFVSVSPQIFWGAFFPHYINGDDHQKIAIKNFIFSINFSFIFFIGFFVCICKHYFDINNVYTELAFFYLAAAQILNDALKKISMAEQKIETAYFADVINWSSVVVCVYFGSLNSSMLFPLIIGSSVSVIFMLWSISEVLFKFGKNGKRKDFDLMKESMMLKIGSFAYLFKDTIIASILTNSGVGLYSIYSYASKAVTMIFASIATPQIEREGNAPKINEKYKDKRNFLVSILRRVVPVFLTIHLAVIISVYLGLSLGLQTMIGFDVDYYRGLSFYVILFPLSMLYVCEHSLNKYCQATRNYRMLNITNATCFFLYVCVWILCGYLGVAWIYMFLAIYGIHSMLIFLFLNEMEGVS